MYDSDGDPYKNSREPLHLRGTFGSRDLKMHFSETCEMNGEILEHFRDGPDNRAYIIHERHQTLSFLGVYLQSPMGKTKPRSRRQFVLIY